MQPHVVSPAEQSNPSFVQNTLANSELIAGDTDASEDTEQLENAFDLFNDLSYQLMGSYKLLEQKVTDLSSELDLVTEQRLQELTEKEQLANRLETLINGLPGGVVVLDSSGSILESNPAAESMLESDLSGQSWREIVSRCFIPREDDGHEVSNKQGQRVSIVTRSLDDDGQIILLTDQTETRRLQSELSRNERLSALGKIVSTLAHQIRTPLSSAMLYANHLCDELLSDSQRNLFSKKIKNRLEFMERQVRDMLLFVKGDVPLTDNISFDAFKHSLIEHIEAPIGMYGAKLVLNFADDKCTLQCNQDALNGALMNLVMNSLQVTKNLELTINCYIDKQQLILQVIDNGTGIDPQLLGDVKGLFFTTKEQGTGIGLSVVNHVAQSHGGQFILKNRQNVDGISGLCAELHLPIICHSSST